MQIVKELKERAAALEKKQVSGYDQVFIFPLSILSFLGCVTRLSVEVYFRIYLAGNAFDF